MLQKIKKRRQPTINYYKYIRISSKHIDEYLNKSQIIYIESYKSYSWIYLDDDSKTLSCKTIGYYQELFSNSCIVSSKNILI